MDFAFDQEKLRQGLLFYLVFVVSISIHEWAHAFMADKLGDDTPRSQGRVTLNPLVHMDLFGTVIFPLVCIFAFPGGILFGWGRPVMINPSNFKNRKSGEVLTTMAGPLSNLVIALIAAVAGGLLAGGAPRTTEIFAVLISLNVVLAVFNLLPVPPLDGGTLMKHATNMSEETYFRIAQWSWLVLLIAIQLPPVRYALGLVISLLTVPYYVIFQLLAR
ncbi:MAG: site-2 protease family protein [Opitutaceae bacterium]|nr:site-2 protease family protein [Opitutaceae bacterium]MBP9914517.1 site-2 protease family protein [Opitutaceae bacterium]